MKLYHGTLLCLLCLLTLPVRTEPSVAEGRVLSIMPTRCVALHQGQKCYQKLSFKLNTPENGEYCLFRSASELPIICWKGSSLSKYIYKFQSTKSESFHITNQISNSTLASHTVRVAWVYKSKKKVPTGWRLF